MCSKGESPCGGFWVRSIICQVSPQDVFPTPYLSFLRPPRRTVSRVFPVTAHRRPSSRVPIRAIARGNDQECRQRNRAARRLFGKAENRCGVQLFRQVAEPGNDPEECYRTAQGFWASNRRLYRKVRGDPVIFQSWPTVALRAFIIIN